MRETLVTIRFYFLENLKTKIYYVLILFSFLMMITGFLLTGLSGFEQPYKVIIDSGLVTIELFCLLIIIINSAELLLKDIETKSIYLVLSKRISRTKYILARYLSLLLTILFNICILCVMHLFFIKISKGDINLKNYILTLCTIFLKAGIIGNICMLAAICVTSQIVAIIISLLFWIIGHFVLELNFIIDKIPIFLTKFFLKIFVYIIPNFQYFDLKNFFEINYFVSKFNLALGILYWLSYNSLILCLAIVLFNKKDL